MDVQVFPCAAVCVFVLVVIKFDIVLYILYMYFMLLRHTICQRKNSACHILKFFLLCHCELKPSEEAMEYVKQYCYCVNICLSTYIECFLPHKKHVFNLKNVPKKSRCVLKTGRSNCTEEFFIPSQLFPLVASCEVGNTVNAAYWITS